MYWCLFVTILTRVLGFGLWQMLARCGGLCYFLGVLSCTPRMLSSMDKTREESRHKILIHASIVSATEFEEGLGVLTV